MMRYEKGFSMNRRIVLTFIFLMIAFAALVMGLVSFNTTNAPLQLGDNNDIDEGIISASEDGIIPLGTAPRDLLLITDMLGDWDVVLLQSDGTLVNLTADDSGAQDLAGSFSFDVQTVNFLSTRVNPEETGPSQVQVDGSNLRNMTIMSAVMTVVRDQQLDWDATWSPDGTQLAWISVRDINLELYTVSLEDGIELDNAVRRTNDGARDWYPAWSPDGSQIVFNNDSEGNENLYMLDVESGEITQLTDNPDHDLHGAWLLDGSGIIFVRDEDMALAKGIMNIYIMNPDGSEQRKLGEDEIISVDPVWSPNASHVAYMSNEGGYWHIYVMQADGSNLRRVTDGEANFLLPTWKP